MLQFPAWKYALIVLVVILSTLFALPNLYPKQPSVQITTTRNTEIPASLQANIEEQLKQLNVIHHGIEADAKSLLVRLTDSDQQTKVSDALRAALGSDYLIALNLASTVPSWLQRLNARPMSLGLDLQGGVHFVMQVDQNAALEKRMESYVESVRSTLRDNSLRYNNVSRRGVNTIVATLETEELAQKANKILPNSLGSLASATQTPSLSYKLEGKTLVITVSEEELSRIAADAIDQNRAVIANRINALGVAEPILQRQGTDRLVIELPGLQDTAEAKRQIGATATLEFRAVTGDERTATEALRSNIIPADSRIYYDKDQQPLLLSKRVLVSGDQLIDARPQPDGKGGTAVGITLNSAGGTRMREHTLENVGKRLGIVYIERIPTVTMVDGKEVRGSRIEERVISASTIQGVFGKDFQTTGLLPEEANSLAKQLKSGALAAPMDFVEERVVGPSLGKENVERGVTAVMFSFVFTLIFFLVYYRMFGVITSIALLLNLLMVVAIMSMFGATMTLPGFAGLALSIGLSVDANVLINERIREELRLGVPPKTSIANGYEKASGTILDANLTGLLAAMALYAFGTGPLQGFALTMGIGIMTSMFTAITVSRALAVIIYGHRKNLKSIAI